jgi:hypothetical protein
MSEVSREEKKAFLILRGWRYFNWHDALAFYAKKVAEDESNALDLSLRNPDDRLKFDLNLLTNPELFPNIDPKDSYEIFTRPNVSKIHGRSYSLERAYEYETRVDNEDDI